MRPQAAAPLCPKLSPGPCVSPAQGKHQGSASELLLGWVSVALIRAGLILMTWMGHQAVGGHRLPHLTWTKSLKHIEVLPPLWGRYCLSWRGEEGGTSVGKHHERGKEIFTKWPRGSSKTQLPLTTSVFLEICSRSAEVWGSVTFPNFPLKYNLPGRQETPEYPASLPGTQFHYTEKTIIKSAGKSKAMACFSFTCANATAESCS